MLTKMTDADWVTVLRVFEASRSRRGDKGRDDKKFLSALHYFVVRFFEALAAMSDTAHLVQNMAGASRRVRQLEQRLEKVLATEPSDAP